MLIVVDARIINSSTGTYVKKLLDYLQKIDQQNNYAVLVPSKDLNYWQPQNPNFKVLAADFANYSLREQFAFKKFLNKLKPDLVHFCMPQQPIFYGGKSVTTFHDLTLLKTYNSDKNWLVFKFKQQVGKLVFKRALQKNQLIITPSAFTKQDILAHFKVNEQKIIVIHEATEKSVQKNKPFEHGFEHFLLYVGQQSDYKNIKRLAAAHQKLLAKYPDLGLILVGKLNRSALKNQAYFKKHNYKNILFTGFISNQQRDWLYQNTTAYVFPSLMEGFGLPGLEAMAHGAPVISSNATCLPEIYGDGAEYFNPLDVADIAQSIDNVLSNPARRLELIERAQIKITQYSWQKMAKQTLEVYQKALKAKN